MLPPLEVSVSLKNANFTWRATNIATKSIYDFALDLASDWHIYHNFIDALSGS
jgi:hypothetical protein